MEGNPAFFIGLMLGAVMLASVCFVYIKHQKFGLGGATLSGLAVILVGMSVWKSIDVRFDDTGFSARLDRVEELARQASNDAEQAKNDTVKTGQTVTSLKNTLTTVIAQEKLKSANLYSGVSDGQMNPETKAALRRLQVSKGLIGTGELDEPTKNALGIKLGQSVHN